MDLISQPVNQLQGSVQVPGDKSISHRALMLGALATGQTTVNNFLNALDCLATKQALNVLGVTTHGPDQNNQILIDGVGLNGLKAPTQALDLGNSGTSLRLLSGILVGQHFNSELTGDASLLKRPMARIIEPLQQMGAQITATHAKPPLLIQGQQALKNIQYRLPIASAQLKSCLLFAAMYAEGQTEIIEPSPSRNHTELMLQHFQYPLEIEGERIRIQGSGSLQACTIDVPGDISSAAFFIVAATIAGQAELRLTNVGINPTRLGIIKILQAMAADISFDNKRFFGAEPVADIVVKAAELQAVEIPLEWIPLAIDELPIICIAAACATGLTKIRGAKELRVKESDRIAAMAAGLAKVGIKHTVYDDGLDIVGGEMQGAEIDSYGDHRIAMAFAVAGLKAKRAISIKNCDNVATSFPEFAAMANQIGMKVANKDE